MKKTVSSITVIVFIEMICIAYSIIVIYPLLWTTLSSFKQSVELFINPGGLPRLWKYQNYHEAWYEFDVRRYFLNSIFVTTISVTAILLLSAMGTFAITRLKFKGSRLVLLAFVGGLFLPKALLFVPLFLLLQDMHILNSYIGLIPVYIAYSFPFTIFVLVPFFNNIPNELEEAALMDGASYYAIFWKVALPLAKPGIIVAGIFNVFGIWSEYVLAFVLISSNKLRTLPLGIAYMLYKQHYTANYGVLFAGLVIAVIPVFLVYVFFQKWLRGGIMAGALKE